MVNAMLDDLFGAPVVPGLKSASDVVSVAEEQALIARIDSCDLEPFKFQGWLGKRLTTSFGSRYDFEHARMDAAPPLPDWLLALRDRAARFAGLDAGKLVQALLLRYDPGAGIGWHRDRPVYEHVIGISLGVPAMLRLRRRRANGFDRAGVPLDPRSIYLLSGEVRHDWEHSIAPQTRPRWSITFRSMASAR